MDAGLGCSHVPVCDVGLDETEHLLSSLGDLDEDTVVDLQETEELQNLARLWCNFIDTMQSQFSQHNVRTSILTHEYGRRSTPSPARERRSRQRYEQLA